MTGSVAQVSELQSCIRDLLSLLALPSLWSGREPREVAALLFDSLRAILPMDFAYVRVGQPGSDEEVELLQLGDRDETLRATELLSSLGAARTGGGTIPDGPLRGGHVFHVPLGWYGGTGELLVGSRHPEFPTPIHVVLMRAASSLLQGGIQTANLNRASVAASRAKDEFLAMLGHELRNPLSPIVSALELLKNRESQSKEVVIIERQLQRVLNLVDDLLDIARITRGKVELHKTPVELATIIGGAVEMTAVLIAEQRHSFSVDVPSSGLVVDADPMRLTQVISNLLSNAAKYTPSGGHIRIAAKASNEQIELSITDTGVGIPKHQLPTIFDLFVQGKTTIHRREGGLGIGLAVVKNLVQMHGGTVEAFSEGPGKGTEFRIRLPRSQQSASRPPPPVASVSSSAAARHRILVVDDNQDAAELLTEVLRLEGHEVEFALDGGQALEKLSSFRPSVAILDIGLPGLDGYELADRVRAQLAPHSVTLIALTGYGQAHDRERSRRAGFAVHLVKPIDLRSLITALP
ncbi:MAG: ATP-binding protein [Myxococcota bacterium]|nr:ATP-binding protein [Myxococcota bacterium]